MSASGFSVGTFTGGGTFGVESLGGTLTPVGIAAWGGAGTVNRVGPSMAAAMPVGIYGGTFNAGTVSVAGTVPVSGAISGTVNTANAGTVAMLQGGTISTIAGGTVVATAAGTQTVAGTVSVSGGTVNPAIGQGKTLQYGTINLASGTQTLVAAPGAGTAVHLVSYVMTCGTVASLQFGQGAGASLLSGTMSMDQYGGAAAIGQPSAPLIKTAAGSALTLVALSGTPNVGGHFSYFVE